MIFPVPKIYDTHDGIYDFKKSLTDDNLYDFYNDCLCSDEIVVLTEATLEREAYKINIDENGVQIVSACDEGTFRALTSLFQLYKKGNGKVNYSNIEDKPDFERRAYMLDISRCRIPKPHTIKRLIDILAMLKYNEFQLYMENFCFKYPLFPEVTEGFECLTPEDIKDIEKYCHERFIDLVPNQNCFGHMAKWIRLDEYKHLEVGENGQRTGTINPLLPESHTLVEKILDSLLPYFESDYVNIGFDEAFGLGKYQLEEYCNKYGKDTLFMEYLNRVSGYISQNYNKKVQFWSDMIRSYPDSFKKIPDGAVVLEWGYELINERMMEKHCSDLHDKNIDFYVCPSCNHHFSLTGRFDIASSNIRTSAEIGRTFGAKGCMLTDWSMGGEGHPHFLVWSFLPAAMGGQHFWNIEEVQKRTVMETYYERMAREFLDYFVFNKVKISEHIQRLANYVFLEPERVRLGTMCGMTLWQDLSKTSFAAYFDLKDCGADFYFDNVVDYVEKIIADVEKIEMDSGYKREIIVNSKIVVLAAHFCKLRKNKEMDCETANYLTKLIDEIYDEFKALWDERNYEEGLDCFLGVLSSRKADLESYM